jgi:hypothetical protein
MLMLGAVVASGGAAQTARGADAAAPSPAFQPPLDLVMLLSRALWCSLADGREIVATRRYPVRFVPQDPGWRVDGELLASEIVATRRYPVRFVPQDPGWRVDGELLASEIDAPMACSPATSRGPAPDCAIMASCNRRIVTAIGPDRCLTREQWTLDPLAAVASR